MLWILLFSVFLGLSCGQQKVFELAGDNPESEDGVLLKMEGQKPSHHHPKARGVVLQAKFSAQTPLIIAPYPLHDNPHYLSLDASFSNKAPSMRQDLSAIGIEPALAQAELEAAQFPDPFANALQTPPPPGSVALDPQKGFRLTGTDDFTRMKPLQLPGQSPGDPSIFVPESEQQMMVPPPPEPVMDSPAPAPREYLGGYEIPMDQHGMPVLNLPCDQYLMALCSGNPNCCKAPLPNPTVPITGQGCMRKELGSGECEFIRANCHACGFCSGMSRGNPAPMQKVHEKQFVMEGSSVLLRIRCMKKPPNRS